MPTRTAGSAIPSDAEVQLLFFPTGGGKTEAYLGLAAYTFAIRRLQGVVGSGPDAYDGTRGVAVLMRYTLRLLTAQQFQRASALVCACEMLRRERLDAGDSRWGTTPFRIGLWVGSSVSPNSFEEAERQITESRGSERVLGGVLQLPVCPWCGSRLSSGERARPTGCGGGCSCTARTPRGTARSRRGTLPTRGCRCSPWTRRSTG